MPSLEGVVVCTVVFRQCRFASCSSSTVSFEELVSFFAATVTFQPHEVEKELLFGLERRKRSRHEPVGP
jgi:hypothetical protein